MGEPWHSQQTILSRVLSNRLEPWQRNLLVAWLAQFLCLLGFDACFPFIPFYGRELGIADPDQVKLWAGAIMSASAMAMAFVSPLWGILADRKGPWLMVLRAAFGGAITLVAMALATTPSQFFVIRVIQAALTGFNLAFVMLVSASAPPEKLGLSLGTMQMGAYLAFSAGPVIGGVFADRFGYRWTYALSAILLVAGGVLVWTLAPRASAEPDPAAKKGTMRMGLGTIAHSPSLWTVLIVVAALYMANSLSRPVLPLFVESLTTNPDLLNTSTGAVYGVVSFASALSAIIVGRLSDRVGARRILIVSASGLALAYLGQAMTSTWIGLLAVTFGIGVLVGGLMPTTNAVIARIAPRNQQGTVYGLGNTLSSGGRMIGPMLGGSIAATWGIRSAFVVTAVLFGLVAIGLSLAPQPGKSESIRKQ